LPSISERLRRPLDESMLLRLVMISGLVSGTDLAKFYSTGGGGLDASKSLEQFLTEQGVDAQQLEAVKRAYAETSDFGTELLRHLRNRHADETKLRAARRALNACETAQLMAIKKGKKSRRIGEMMVELGHLNAGELDELIHQQGMLHKIKHYSEQARLKSTLAGRLGLDEAGKKLTLGKVLPAVLVVGLAIVVLLSLWHRGCFDSSLKPEREAWGGAFNPGKVNHNINKINEHYANMITELKKVDPQNPDFTGAERHRGLLDTCFADLKKTKTMIDEQSVLHIRQVYRNLDFEKIKQFSAAELPSLGTADIEAKLSK